MKNSKKRACLGLELLEDRVAPATYWVVNIQDNAVGGFDAATQRNEGSLRWAMAQTNADSMPDEIRFSIPGAGPYNIVLDTTLPDLTITNPVAILGDTQQPNNPLPTIAINGNGRAYGFVVRGTSAATISSLIVTRCASAEILVDNSTNTQITGSLLGIDLKKGEWRERRHPDHQLLQYYRWLAHGSQCHFRK